MLMSGFSDPFTKSNIADILSKASIYYLLKIVVFVDSENDW